MTPNIASQSVPCNRHVILGAVLWRTKLFGHRETVSESRPPVLHCAAALLQIHVWRPDRAFRNACVKTRYYPRRTPTAKSSADRIRSTGRQLRPKPVPVDRADDYVP